VSKILPDSELQAARSQLSQDQYDQEYECSFDAAILGAFYGQEMRQAQDAGQDIVSCPLSLNRLFTPHGT
jgi:phage terminase large subunit